MALDQNRKLRYMWVGMFGSEFVGISRFTELLLETSQLLDKVMYYFCEVYKT